MSAPALRFEPQSETASSHVTARAVFTHANHPSPAALAYGLLTHSLHGIRGAWSDRERALFERLTLAETPPSAADLNALKNASERYQRHWRRVSFARRHYLSRGELRAASALVWGPRI